MLFSDAVEVPVTHMFVVIHFENMWIYDMIEP